MKARLLLFALLFPLSFSAGTDSAQREIMDENLDSLSHSFQEMTRNLSTAEFERRKKVLKTFQRRGYVEVLADVVADDGLSAFFSLLRVNAQIAYHLPHDALVFHIPPTPSTRPPSQSPWHFLAPASQPYAVPLIQDWTFPEDPWSGQ